MLWLKLILFILLSEISERTMCSASSAKENENAPRTLPQDSLINDKDPNGCLRQLLPFFEDVEMGNGFLDVNCTKPCKGGKTEDVVTGNLCVATLIFLNDDKVDVTVESCNHGSCKPISPTKHLTVSLMKEGEEEEEEGEEEEEEVEEEEEEGGKK
uniref:Putative evasin n=1 Tax=Ixodes ricinus TaxID=34613 RepID=A0A6B0UWJ8_IXORI